MTWIIILKVYAAIAAISSLAWLFLAAFGKAGSVAGAIIDKIEGIESRCAEKIAKGDER